MQRLPPVHHCWAESPESPEAPETATATLIKGLRGLDPRQCGGAPKSAPAGLTPLNGDRVMRVISRFGQRANDRVAEAMMEMKDGDAKGSTDSGQSHAVQLTSFSSPTSAQQAFDSIVDSCFASIDHVLSGGVSSCRMVRRDETVDETVPHHAVKFYKVPLPSRPTVVTVSLARTSGVPATMWASTSHERPNAKSNEIKGKDDKVIYEHAIMHAEEGEDLGTIDRRNAVPPCRELFVAVEAEAGEVSYTLKVQHQNIKIVLTRNEISSQLQKMKRGWETRLDQLRREPAQREQFEEHILGLQEMMLEKKKELHGGKNFAKLNLESIQDEDRNMKLAKLQAQALKRCANRDAALKRREAVDKKKETKMKQDIESKMNRAEMRIQSKIEQERQRLERLRIQDVLRDWLVRLALIAFTEKTMKKSMQLRDERKRESLKAASAWIIYQFVRRCMFMKRRNDLYRNVIRFRMALVVFARHIRLAVVHSATPILSEFLQKNVFNKEAPDLKGAITGYRAKMKKIQNWWRRMRTIRLSFVILLTPDWMEIQTEIYKVEAELLADKKEEANKKRRASLHRRSSGHEARRSTKHLSLGDVQSSMRKRGSLPPGGTQRDDVPKESIIESIKMQQDQLPVREVKKLLYEIVSEKHCSFRQRLQEWQTKYKDKEDFKADLEACGIVEDDSPTSCRSSSSKRKVERPRKVDIERTELESKVAEAIKMWKDGKSSRTRLVKRIFRAFQRRCLAKQRERADTPSDFGEVLGDLF